MFAFLPPFTSFLVFLLSKQPCSGTTAYVRIGFRNGIFEDLSDRYPELFPRNQLYNTKAQLRKMLKDCCIRPEKIRNRNRMMERKKYEQYCWDEQKKEWDIALSFTVFYY